MSFTFNSSAASPASSTSKALELNCGHIFPQKLLRQHAREYTYCPTRYFNSTELHRYLNTICEVNCPLCRTTISTITVADPSKGNSVETPEMMLAAIKTNFEMLKLAGDAIRNDKNMNIQIVRKEGWALQYSLFANDIDVAIEAIKQNYLTIRFVDPRLFLDRKFVLATVQIYGSHLSYFKNCFRNDPEIVLAAVQNCGCALKYSTDYMKLNETIVRAAVKKDGEALKYAFAFQDNASIVLEAVSNKGNALEYAAASILNETIVRAAVKNNGSSLKYAPAFQNNKSIVLEAVSNNGWALCDASPELKGDLEVVMAAVKQNGFTLRFAAPKVLKNFDVVLAAVTESGDALQIADGSLRKNKAIVLAAVKQNGFALSDAPAFYDDREVVEAAMRQNYNAFRLSTLQDDQEMVELAIDLSASCYCLASKRLRLDLGIIMKAIQKDGLMLEYVPHEMFKENIALTAVSQNGLALEFARWFKHDKLIVGTAIKQNEKAKEFAPKRILKKLL